MRCEDATGFLMLRRCENVAEFRCSYCGRGLCSEHAIPLVEPASATGAAPAPGTTAVPAEAVPPSPPAPTGPPAEPQPSPPAPPAPGEAVACHKCLQQRQPGYYDSYFYAYPYYGGYSPYYYDYDDYDRSVFARQGVEGTGAVSDASAS